MRNENRCPAFASLRYFGPKYFGKPKASGQAGRIKIVEAVLLFLILGSLGSIGRTLWLKNAARQAARAPQIEISKEQASPFELQQENMLLHSFLRLQKVDETLGSYTPFTDAEWSRITQSTFMLDKQVQQAPGCTKYTSNSNKQTYWTLGKKQAELLQNGQTILVLSATSNKCFATGHEGPIYYFPYESSQPAVVPLGQAKVEHVFTMSFEEASEENANLLRIPLQDLKLMLDFPNRKAEHKSTFVRLKLIARAPIFDPKADPIPPPSALPGFRRLTAPALRQMVQERRRDPEAAKNIIIIDFRGAEESAESLLYHPDFDKYNFMFFGRASFKNPAAADLRRNFDPRTTYESLLKAKLTLDLPPQYQAINSSILMVGADELDARPYWAILRLIQEHNQNNIYWVHRGGEWLAAQISRMRYQQKDRRGKAAPIDLAPSATEYSDEADE
jgi:hypothetical protein